MLFLPLPNFTSETLSWRNMPLCSCSSSHHLQTRLLQLCPLWSPFIHTTTPMLGSTHCCSSNRDLSPRDHIKLTLKQLHWLPIRIHIAFKISLLMYHIHFGASPPYMLFMVTPCFASSSRGLWSSTQGDFAVIHTNLKFGNRAFSVSGPREWNNLPASVHQCTSLAQFKSKLKTHPFSVYYD